MAPEYGSTDFETGVNDSPMPTQLGGRAAIERKRTMRETIRDGQSKIIGYRETGSGNRQILRDTTGRIMGRFETNTGITKTEDGKIVGRGSNQTGAVIEMMRAPPGFADGVLGKASGNFLMKSRHLLSSGYGKSVDVKVGLPQTRAGTVR